MKNCVISRKVKKIIKLSENQYFTYSVLNNSSNQANKVSKCLYWQAGTSAILRYHIKYQFRAALSIIVQICAKKIADLGVKKL